MTARKAQAIPTVSPIAPLPYAAVSLFDHWTKDIARFWGSVSQAPGPAEVFQAEAEFDSQLWRDYLQATQDLWMLPFRMASAGWPAPQGKPDAAGPQTGERPTAE